MPVRSQIAFNPNPAEEPWRASRINNTLEITPTGAEPGPDFETRGMAYPGDLQVEPQDLKAELRHLLLEMPFQHAEHYHGKSLKARELFHLMEPYSQI
jgi:hypothetical protein